MRTEVWGPQAKGERPDMSGFSSVLKSVRRAMGWSGKSADKTAEAEAKKFLDDSLPSKEPPRLDSMTELKSVLEIHVQVSLINRLNKTSQKFSIRILVVWFLKLFQNYLYSQQQVFSAVWGP